MALLFSYAGADPLPWRREFLKHIPELDFRVYPDIGDPADIEFAAVWMHPERDLRNYPNLKAILSLGAGVEHIIEDPDLPPGVPIVRLVDDRVIRDVALHVVHWVIHFHRSYHRYRQDQSQRIWRRHHHMEPRKRRVGFLGMGAVGVVAAKLVHDMGFTVAGWGLDPVHLDGIDYYQGGAALSAFLQQTDILVNALPLTAATRDLLNAARFAKLPKGACLINVSRGPILVEEDLVAALESGQVEAAALDVFRTEPLPTSSSLWSHPKVFVTPHIAGINYPESAAKLMAQNIRRMQSGQTPFPMYDSARGY